MRNQVLSIEQMQELIDMGIDTSYASCIWWNFADLGFSLMPLDDGRDPITLEKMKENYGAENVVPAFTLQDILEMLPVEIDRLLWRLGHGCVYYQDVHTGYINENLVTYGDTILNAAFNMLKKCKQNNYI